MKCERKPAKGLLVRVFMLLKDKMGEFPGGPVVRTRQFHCRGPGSIPAQGTKIPQAARCAPRPKKREKEMKDKQFLQPKM